MAGCEMRSVDMVLVCHTQQVREREGETEEVMMERSKNWTTFYT